MPTYDETTARDIPVEIRTRDVFDNKHVLTAALTGNGLISYSFAAASGGVSLSLSNMQSKRAYPRKAVPGWQAEVVAFVKASLEKIEEIR